MWWLCRGNAERKGGRTGAGLLEFSSSRPSNEPNRVTVNCSPDVFHVSENDVGEGNEGDGDNEC